MPIEFRAPSFVLLFAATVWFGSMGGGWVLAAVSLCALVVGLFAPAPVGVNVGAGLIAAAAVATMGASLGLSAPVCLAPGILAMAALGVGLRPPLAAAVAGAVAVTAAAPTPATELVWTTAVSAGLLAVAVAHNWIQRRIVRAEVEAEARAQVLRIPRCDRERYEEAA